MIKNGDLGHLPGLQETYSKGIMKQMWGMDSVKCIGLMEVITKGNG
jgi:hypothetical protein